jgi:hypothetical protein
VTRSVGQTVASQKLSIVARGRQLGTAAAQMTDRDAVVRQEPDLLRQLAVIMAGTAGERMAFGCLSTGVNDDLHAATQLARSMVTSFGMSPQLGPVTIGEQNGEVFLGASLQELGSVGPRPSSSSTARSSGSSSRPSAARRSSSSATGPPSRRRPTRCSSRRRCRASRSRPCCRRWSRCRSSSTARTAPTARGPSPTTARDPRDPHGRQHARDRRDRPPRARDRRARAGADLAPRAARPAEGFEFRTPLGSPGDLQFFENRPNRGLLGIEGNASIPRGLYLFDGERWRQLSTVCGGPRTACASRGPGPPSGGRSASRARRAGADDHALPVQGRPGRRLLRDARHVAGPVPRHGRGDRATGRSDCWFGGVGSQDATGTGAAPSTCTGTARRCAPSTTRRGAASATSRPIRARSSSPSSWAAGPRTARRPRWRGPRRRGPRLLHRIVDGGFRNDDFVPRAARASPVDGAELPALDSDGPAAVATGGRRGPTVRAPAGGVPRGPLVRRACRGVFRERS